MAIGYERFKTPFFDLYVGGPNDTPDKMIKLPYQILKLIEKIEITKTFDTCKTNDVLNITFIEGSREPYSQLKSANAELYKEEGSKASLGNQAGLIPDLTFVSGGVGIKDLNSLIDKSKDLTSFITDASSLLPIDGLVFKDEIDIDKPKEKVDLKYLFQEGNKIKVIWGYLEQTEAGHNRSMISQISLVQTDFPENGMPTTTITATGHSNRLDRLSTPIGVKFSKKVKFGIDSNTGKIILLDEDLTTEELLQKICNDGGMDLIITANLVGDKLNKDNVKKWIAGESIHQLFTRLANRHNCYYSAYINPHNGKETVAFIKRSEFEQISTIEDANLFVYKGNGSILKSVSIKCEFDGVTGSTLSGINRDGKMVTSIVEGGPEVSLFESESLTPQNPGSLNASAKKISSSSTRGGTSTGKVENTPEVDNKGNIKTLANSAANCSSKQITVEFVSLGYYRLEPGQAVTIKNIGERYSNRYHVKTVTHILDSSGYICRVMAMGYGLNGGVGVYPNEFFKAKDKEDATTNVSLFGPKELLDSAKSLSKKGSAKEKYDESR